MLYGGEAAPIPDVTVWGHDLGLPNWQPQFPHLQSLALDSCPGDDSGFRIPAFYTAKYGYKLCLRLYLNGDGTGKRTHLSLFIVIMRGEYDALLPWPFRNKVRAWEMRGFLGWGRPGACSWFSHELACVTSESPSPSVLSVSPLMKQEPGFPSSSQGLHESRS